MLNVQTASAVSSYNKQPKFLLYFSMFLSLFIIVITFLSLQSSLDTQYHLSFYAIQRIGASYHTFYLLISLLSLIFFLLLPSYVLLHFRSKAGVTSILLMINLMLISFGLLICMSNYWGLLAQGVAILFGFQTANHALINSFTDQANYLFTEEPELFIYTLGMFLLFLCVSFITRIQMRTRNFSR